MKAALQRLHLVKVSKVPPPSLSSPLFPTSSLHVLSPLTYIKEAAAGSPWHWLAWKWLVPLVTAL